MQPSQRAATGFWLYSEQDIQTVRTITLFQQLGYSEENIRAILVVPPSQWSTDLSQQILQLTEKKICIEDQLFLAELLRHRDCIQSDAAACSLTGDSELSAWESKKKYALCRFLHQVFSETPLHELSSLMGLPPDNPVIQEQIRRLCDQFWQRNALSPAQLLLILHLARTLSGLIPVLDTLLGAKGSVQFIIDALQHYCKCQ